MSVEVKKLGHPMAKNEKLKLHRVIRVRVRVEEWHKKKRGGRN